MGKLGNNTINEKKELYLLLDKLPPTEISAAKRYLQYIIDKSHEERLLKILENAPFDDEALTEKDLRDIEKSKKEIERGEYITLEQYVKKDLTNENCTV